MPSPSSQSRQFETLKPVPVGRDPGTLQPECSYRLEGVELDISFRLSGDALASVQGLAGAPSLGERRDELWKSTCFEVFFATSGRPGYGELNLSPSGDWASYAFDTVRTGMRPAAAELVHLRRKQNLWHYEVRFDAAPTFLFPCAVVEDERGVTYWSSEPGPEGRIDFHADFWDAWQTTQSA